MPARQGISPPPQRQKGFLGHRPKSLRALAQNDLRRNAPQPRAAGANFAKLFSKVFGT